MALTLQELVDQMKENYHLKLLSCTSGMDYIVTWVYMAEDSCVASLFWGNELVITSGSAIHGEQEMLAFVQTLIEHHCTGLVVNIGGSHFKEIPQSIVDYCRTQSFPLMTMPWNMFMTEFIRDSCTLITKSSTDEADLANAVMNIINAPQASGPDRERLNERFNEEDGFTLLAARADLGGHYQNIMDHRSTLRLHTALRPFNVPYLIFRREKRFFVLVNRKDRQLADDIARHIHDAILEAIPMLPLSIGIGEPVDSYDHLCDSYHAAVSASRRAVIQKLDVVRFRDMGFYKLLYSVPDDEMLLNYYHEIMDPLLIHDKKFNSAYTETLFRYLLRDGSLQEVAADMFTHRNTINYRMGRIREILGQNLDTQAQKLPYLICYHIGVILKLVPDLEA